MGLEKLTPSRKLEKHDGSLMTAEVVELSRQERKLIENLETPLERIVFTLAQEIERGTYSVIIGDDISGHIPAMILAEVAKNISEHAGVPSPLTRYIAGGKKILGEEKERKDELVREEVARIKIDAAATRDGRDLGRVLIVTEAISSGRTMKSLVEAIRSNGWEADIATVGMDMPWSKNSFEDEWGGVRIFNGKWGTPKLHAKGKNLTGLVKDGISPVARPSDEIGAAERAQATAEVAREVAERLTRFYFDTVAAKK